VNGYDDDIRLALKAEFDVGQLLEAGPADDVFSMLAKVYPISGSKIDWTRVPDALEESEREHAFQLARFAAFFDEMCVRFGLKGGVLYVGDNAPEFAIAGTIDAMRRALPILLEIPQHHYFVGPSASWCMCLTMEGDMDFGRAGASPQISN
jgi:hypothetical protein